MGQDQIPDPMAYPLELRRLSEDEGGGWLITFPDLPGCMSDGETIEQAIESGKDAFRSWVMTALEFGDPIPQPASQASISVKIQMPQDLHEALSAWTKVESASHASPSLVLISQGSRLTRRKP